MAFVVIWFATNGIVEAADGGSPAHQHKSVPANAPGAFLGPLPASGHAQTAEADGRYPLTSRPDGGASYDSPEFSATVAPDGSVTFHDHRLRYARRDAAFRFDLSDEFSRELGHGTLYRHEKANFLAATFRQRTDMAARAYASRMRLALDDLPSRLDALWADTRYRRRERRRITFLLWADADPSSPGAHPAQTIIESWIRRRLPPGSPDAYGKSELEALSRERPELRPFTPYGPPRELRPSR